MPPTNFGHFASRATRHASYIEEPIQKELHVPILITTLASLGLAWLRGAPPTHLARVRLRWMGLPIAAFLMQLAAFVHLEDRLASVAPWLHLATMVILLVFLWANMQYRSLLLVAIGVLLNLTVIAANGGYMPVRVTDMERAGFAEVAARLARGERFQKSTALHEGTALPWLADVIHLPLPGPDRLLSLGDVFVAIGAFLFVQEALLGRVMPSLPHRRPRVV
jgi:hypothetical protein